MAFKVPFLVLLVLVVATSSGAALSETLVVMSLNRQSVNASATSQVSFGGTGLGSRSLLSGSKTSGKRTKFVKSVLNRPEFESYLSTTISLGSPGRKFELILDTGSSISYVPCAQCKHCGKHMARSKFLPRQSTSAKPMRCTSQKDCQCDSMGLRCPCLGGRCHYEIKYAEGSMTRGKLMTDHVKIGQLGVSSRRNEAEAGVKNSSSSSSSNGGGGGGGGSNSSSSSLFVDGRVKFGCATHESGQIFWQRADGILGLSMSKFSLVNQLASAGKMRNAFSVCPSQKSGVLAMGSPELNWNFAKKHCRAKERDSSDGFIQVQVPYWNRKNSKKKHLYTLAVKHLSVGETKVQELRQKRGRSRNALGLGPYYPAVIDTGSTMSYLPEEMYTPLVSVLHKQRPNNALQLSRQALRRAGDLCYRLEAGSSLHDFPPIHITFAGQSSPNQPRNFDQGQDPAASSRTLTLKPHAYLYQQGSISRTGQRTYCSLFQKAHSHAIHLGSVMLENFMLVFDNDRRHLDIHSCNCQAMSRQAAAPAV